MKIKALLLVILMLVSISFSNVYADEDVSRKKYVKEEKEMRGLWVASVLNINYPTVSTSNAALLKIEADNIIESASNAGFNAIFLQVRPTADSLYKSDIFPWSKYLTGKEGVAPNNGFDPLEYFIEEAHKRNIELHAWINPYRITKRKADEPAYTVNMLSPKHPARLHPEYVISYDGNLFFDPALKEVRDLITDGVEEIVDNYDIDGIHFDDYFYPAKDFDDGASYARLAYGKDLGDWRRENVNKLVEQVYKAVHSSKKDVIFGISPFGIWANNTSINTGSATSGLQSYFAHYADSLYWIDRGIVDYITPQIYWHRGFEVADFQVLTDWWNNAVRGKDVDLYVGLAAYRADNPDEKSPWYRNDELKNQLAYIKTKDEVDGYIAFSSSSVRSSNRVYNAFRGAGKIKTNDDYEIPSIALYGGADTQYVAGLVYPNTPAYLNGELIKNISDKGFFGAFVDANEEKTYRLENAGLVDEKAYKEPDDEEDDDETEEKNYDYLNEKLKREVLFAKIKEDETNLKADVNPYNGSMELLPKGVMAEIREVHGTVLELTSNRYIDISKVDIVDKNNYRYMVNTAEYISGEELDKIVFTANIKPFIKPYIFKDTMVLEFSGNVSLVDINIPQNAMVTSSKKQYINYRNMYVLSLKDVNDLGGYYVEYDDEKIVFNMKHKKHIKDDDKPLEGIDIVLDAGHGDHDTGALGLLAYSYPEKDVNLDITLKLDKKLRDLGANIILTRDKDEFISLHDRLKYVYNYKPDMFISIHANSCGLHKDVNKIKGFSVYYSKDIAEPYAKLAQRQLCLNTACIDNDYRGSDFYVIRGTHCPSVLLETGFLPNPEDFDWLCDDSKQDEFVSELARTILLYFAHL